MNQATSATNLLLNHLPPVDLDQDEQAETRGRETRERERPRCAANRERRQGNEMCQQGSNVAASGRKTSVGWVVGVIVCGFQRSGGNLDGL